MYQKFSLADYFLEWIPGRGDIPGGENGTTFLDRQEPFDPGRRGQSGPVGAGGRGGRNLDRLYWEPKLLRLWGSTCRRAVASKVKEACG